MFFISILFNINFLFRSVYKSLVHLWQWIELKADFKIHESIQWSISKLHQVAVQTKQMDMCRSRRYWRIVLRELRTRLWRILPESYCTRGDAWLVLKEKQEIVFRLQREKKINFNTWRVCLVRKEEICAMNWRRKYLVKDLCLSPFCDTVTKYLRVTN